MKTFFTRLLTVSILLACNASAQRLFGSGPRFIELESLTLGDFASCTEWSGANFCDDFQSADWSSTGGGFAWAEQNIGSGSGGTSGSGIDGTISFASNAGPNGTGDTVAAFAHSGSSNRSDIWLEQRFSYATTREVWVAYEMFLPSGYTRTGVTNSTLAYNNKMLYLWSGTTYDNFPNNAGIGIEYYQCNSDVDCTTDSVSYLSPVDTSFTGGYQHYDCPNGSGGCTLQSDSGSQVAFDNSPSDRGTWVQFCHQAIMGTSYAANDGVLRVWKKPEGGSWENIFTETSGRFYHTESDGRGGYTNGYLMGWQDAGFANGPLTFYYSVFAQGDENFCGVTIP